MKIIEKDILTVKNGVLIHQVNCREKMGSGIAKSLKDKWPIIFHNYSFLCRNYNSNYLLGKIDPVLVSTQNGELWVVNLFGQDSYGKDGKLYTNYQAWETALAKLFQYTNVSKKLPQQVYLPYLCGCGTGGGDWDIISEKIDHYFPNAIICKLPQ